MSVPPLEIPLQPDVPSVLPNVHEWQPVVIVCAPVAGATAITLRIGPDALGPPMLRPGDPRWRWHWNAEDRVGRFPVVLRWAAPGPATAMWMLVVQPAKLREEHYQALLQALQARSFDLLLALRGGEIGVAPHRDAAPVSLGAHWPQLIAQAQAAVAVADAIQARPHERQMAFTASVPLHELDQLDAVALADLAREPLDAAPVTLVPALQRVLHGALPRQLPMRRTRPTTDTPEHRLLRAVVDQLTWRIAQAGALLADQAPHTAPVGWEAQHRRALQGLHRVQRSALLATLPAATACPAPTHLMQHDRQYRQVYALWRGLRAAPQVEVDAPAFHLPLSDLPTLYEHWCVVETAAALAMLGVVQQEQFWSRDAAAHWRWRLRLAENTPLLTVGVAGATVALVYHRRYTAQAGQGAALGSLDPFTRVPDIALEIRRADAAPRTLLLDAKYRRMPDGTLPQGALDTAYTYHGAIGFAGKPAALGAWLLFPGTHPITAGPVGALPFLPGMTDALSELLGQFFHAPQMDADEPR